MKKTKIALIFTVLIALVCILTACSPKTAKLTDIFNDDPVEGYAPVYTSIEAINFESTVIPYQYTFIKSDGIFASFRGTYENEGYDAYETYIIYNMKLGTVVLDGSRIDNPYGSSSYDFKAIETTEGHYVIALYTIDNETNETHSISLWDETGDWIHICTDSVSDITYNEHTQILTCGKEYFYVKESGEVTDYHAIAKQYAEKCAPEINGSSENYFYYIDEKEAYVYSRDYELIDAYILPSYATSLTNTYFYILDNGNLFVQYLIEEPTDSQDYNLLFEGEKSTLITQIINVKKGTTKEIDCDYLVLSVADAEEFEANINSKLVNVAVAFPIENHRISNDLDSIKVLSMSNNGTVKSVLNETIPAQGLNMPERIADNRYLLSNNLDISYILDNKANVVATVADMEYLTSFAYVSGDSIVNFNGHTIVDLDPILGKFSLIATYDGCYIYENDDTAVTCLLTSAGETSLGYNLSDEINTDSPYFFYYKAFNVDQSSWQHLFYNVNGNLIESVYDYTSVETVCYSEDGNYAILLFSNENGDMEYYRLSI